MSPRFNPDPTADKGSTFPAAEYFLTCTDVSSLDKDGNPLRTAKGDEKYILEMTVADGQYKGRKLWHTLPFIPAIKGENNGHGMTLKCLKAFGIDIESGEVDIEPELFMGKTIRAKVKIEPAKTVNGKTYDARNQIDRFLVVEDQSRVPPPAQSDTSFDTGAMEAERGQRQPAPAPVRQPAPAPAAQQTVGAGAARAKAPWRR